MFAIGTQIETGRTGAPVTADCIRTLTALAVASQFALVNIFANAGRADGVTGFAFALVAVGGIDTFARSANVGPQDALVDLADVSGLLAKLSVRIIATDWAHFAHSIVSPAFAHVDATTAVLFGQFDREFITTLTVATDRRETIASTSINAALAILTGDESLIADAIVSCVRVDALTVLADSLLLALVRLTTLVCILISFLTGWTFAAERADRIDTLSALT